MRVTFAVTVLRGISERLISHIQADRMEKMDLLVNAVIEELERLKEGLDEIGKESSAQAKGRFEVWFPLLVDGLKRAERTRARDRVTRIGLILANALVSPPPIKSDNVEEMMRIAMELSDRDIYFLKELFKIEGDLVEMKGRIDRTSAWMIWANGPWGERVDGEIDSIFSKLESFGLAARLAPPNNLTINADFQNRYALLKKGLDFARFATGSCGR